VAAGVLNFAPAKPDLAMIPEQRLLRRSASVGFGNIFCDQLLGVIEKHAVRFARRFVF